jgi:hypothetical protein
MKFGMEGLYKTLSTKYEFRENLKNYSHRRNFVINILGGSGAKSTTGVRNFNLLRKEWKIGQSQSLINERPFPNLTQFFSCPSSTQ